MRFTHAVAPSAAQTITAARHGSDAEYSLSLAAPPTASLADVVDGVVDELTPFERSVVRMRYDVDETIHHVAESLTSTPDDVAAALMNAYRAIATGLQR